jgi:hypothetical protein
MAERLFGQGAIGTLDEFRVTTKTRELPERLRSKTGLTLLLSVGYTVVCGVMQSDMNDVSIEHRQVAGAERLVADRIDRRLSPTPEYVVLATEIDADDREPLMIVRH